MVKKSAKSVPAGVSMINNKKQAQRSNDPYGKDLAVAKE